MAPVASTIDVVIPEFKEAEQAGASYTTYRVECYEGEQLVASAWKRYSEFAAFNKELANAHELLLSLPPKQRFGRVDVEMRRVWLQCALQAYAQGKDLEKSPLAGFLGLDNSNPHNHHAANKDDVQAANAALNTAMASTDELLIYHCLQKKAAMASTVLLFTVGPLLHFASWSCASMLLLGACSALWICVGISQKDLSQRKAAMQDVKQKASQLSEAIRMMSHIGGSVAGQCAGSLTRSFSREASQESAPSTPNASAAPQYHPSVSASPSTGTVLQTMPDALKVIADDCCTMLTQHLGTDTNGYGQPWEVCRSPLLNKNQQVWSSKVPGQSRKVWKSLYTFTSKINFDQFVDYIMVWDQRLKWDQGFSIGENLTEFEGGCNVCRYCTKQILTVSPREFVDLASCRVSADRRSFLYFFKSLTSNDLPGLPSPSRGMVRGESMKGSGLRVTLLSSDQQDDGSMKNVWQMEVIAEADPKGWIPVSVINNAFAMTLSDNYRDVTSYFTKL